MCSHSVQVRVLSHTLCVLVLASFSIGCQKIVTSKPMNPTELPFVSVAPSNSNHMESRDAVHDRRSAYSTAASVSFKASESNVLAWSSEMSRDIAHNTLDYRSDRIQNQILPELDRMQSEIKARMLSLNHEEYLRQQTVIETVRQQWIKELQLLRRQLGELEASSKL